MAITFTSGTATEASVVLAATTIQSAMRDALVAKTGYTLVEEFTPGSGAANYVVIKLAAATSGLSTDLYIVIARVIATGQIQFAIGEAYNSGTHTLSKYAPYANNQTLIVQAADRTYAGTYVLGVTAPPLTTATNPCWVFGSPAATQKWFVAADNDHCILGIAGVRVAYLGAIDSLVYTPATNDPVPVVCVDMMGVQGNFGPGACTRHPLTATGGAGLAHNFGIAGPFPQGGNASGMESPIIMANWSNGTGVIGYATPDLFSAATPRAQASKLICYHNVGAAAGTQGRVRGRYKPTVKTMTLAPGGVAVGDTFSIDGNAHYMAYNSAPYMLMIDTGVAG